MAATAAAPDSRAAQLGFGAAAFALVALAWRLPVWEARLTAPQFPPPLGPLRLTAYGHGVVGDVESVNQLNHYVGMQAFSDGNAPEIGLWGPTVLLALAAVAVATLLPRTHIVARLARWALWLVPLGVLVDIQYRLWQYGQSVKPDAAIRVDPFTPLVVGPTKVLNFTTWAYPGLALWCVVLAAFLMSFGPGLWRRGNAWWRRRPIYVSQDEFEAMQEGAGT